MDTTEIRRASDTRSLPEIPKASIESLRKITGTLSSRPASTPTKYGPVMGPTGGPPLTTSQADQLITNSFPGERYKIVQPYKSKLLKNIVDHSVGTPANKRRSFETLDRLSKNICSYEVLSGTLINLRNIIQRLKDAELDDLDESIENAITGALKGLAVHIVDGFDFVDEVHFVFDKDGNPIDITPANRGRKPLCLAKIQANAMRKEQSGQFTEFLKQQSDPFKGSQQGQSRTRKHKKKSKKTRKHRTKH